MPPLFLYSRVVLHWGFIVRQLGASAAQLAYLLPPPPTIVGSFMNPLTRLLGLGESLVNREKQRAGPEGSYVMRCALTATIAAAAGLTESVGIAVYAEPSRIAAALYKTGGDYTSAVKQPPYLAADKLLPVQAEGQASAPGASLTLSWLVDPEKLSQCLDTSISINDLEVAAWNIYRIGSKEGIASVVEAGIVDHDNLHFVSEGNIFRSILYQPVDCVSPMSSVISIILYDTKYRETAYYVPSLEGGPVAVTPTNTSFRFALNSGCRAVHPGSRPELSLSSRHIGGGY